MLSAERTALNFLQRLSGIATGARRYVAAAGGRTTVLDTRQDDPHVAGPREVRRAGPGGATNHRLGLGDGLLIKDNHVRLAGSIAAAVARARAGGRGLAVEVEVQSLAEVDEALAAGADTVLIDNLSNEQSGEAIARCRGRARTEVSGRVTLARLDALAALGPTSVSVGALTHSAAAVDISFEMAPASLIDGCDAGRVAGGPGGGVLRASGAGGHRGAVLPGAGVDERHGRGFGRVRGGGRDDGHRGPSERGPRKARAGMGFAARSGALPVGRPAGFAVACRHAAGGRRVWPRRCRGSHARRSS